MINKGLSPLCPLSNMYNLDNIYIVFFLNVVVTDMSSRGKQQLHVFF